MLACRELPTLVQGLEVALTWSCSLLGKEAFVGSAAEMAVMVGYVYLGRLCFPAGVVVA